MTNLTHSLNFPAQNSSISFSGRRLGLSNDVCNPWQNHQVGHNTDVNQEEMSNPPDTEMAGGGERSIQPIPVSPHTAEVQLR